MHFTGVDNGVGHWRHVLVGTSDLLASMALAATAHFSLASTVDFL
jgi:anti-sigma-K factor RskA